MKDRKFKREYSVDFYIVSDNDEYETPIRNASILVSAPDIQTAMSEAWKTVSLDPNHFEITEVRYIGPRKCHY